MADGDVKIYNLFASHYTTGAGGTNASFTPAVPTIADGECWLVHALVWRTMADIADDPDDTYMKVMEQWMNVQDVGDGGWSGHRYATSSVIPILTSGTFLGGEETDTIALDHVGGMRLWFDSADAQNRRWFAHVTIHYGDARYL
jgi:hypothetical protein